MAEHFPLTVEQLRQTTSAITEIRERLGDIAELLRAGYGDGDQRTIRAQEAHASLQRLELEMERAQKPT